MRKREALDAAVEEAQSREDPIVAGLSERADSVEESGAAIDAEPDYGSLIIDQGVDE